MEAQATARRTLRLVAEVEVARQLVIGLHHHLVAAALRDETLKRLLERYAEELGLVKPAPPDVH